MSAQLFQNLSHKPVSQQRYALVDLLRGFAALSVLIWHYQHFFFPMAGADPVFASRADQPFYGVLSLFYQEGLYAVHLFWVISGFVFASVYGGRKTTAKAFIVNRLSRLYPLHIITLVVVAGLQIFSQSMLGYEQIYTHTDWYHFTLNLFFISDWGFQQGYSFNAPIWSVSIEIFIYMIFFIVARPLFRLGVAGPLFACAVFSALIWLRVPGAFWWCGLFFFAGTTVWAILEQWVTRTVVLLCLIMVLVGFFLWFRFLPPLSIRPELFFLPLFCSMILLAGTLDRRCAIEGLKRWRWLGDNTYGTYLWHVPVQMMILIGMDLFQVDRMLATHPLFFIGFLTAVCLLARWSFLHIERPAQQFLRQRLT